MRAKSTQPDIPSRINLINEVQIASLKRQVKYYKTACSYLLSKETLRCSEAGDKVRGLKRPSVMTKQLKKETDILRKQTSSLRPMIIP